MRRAEEGYSYQIEVDGGINSETIKLIYDAGATLAVMGTAFFREENRREYISSLLESL